ncbi:RDD family protein [Fulvivirga ulvae]|uniref:RDD family protein n=1 Tax=Fulvivirga ulvae TaxID=2904245 RepID=UPI001F19A416|nr:RDD family protein [Fulvivirga ulvae]UII34194.1 RDD family protein [Fulvivirga ulvae]
MSQKTYPTLPTRVKALMADVVVLMVLMIFTTYLFSSFDHISDNSRMIAFVFIFYLYDPLFTSAFGGTLGHYLLGVRVRREDKPEKKLLFHMALLRFIFKSLLGWLSLLTVTENDKKRAIHDYLAQSVVVHTKESVTVQPVAE